MSISLELENRQKVRGELSQFVDDIVVSQQMIKYVDNRAETAKKS